MKYVIWKLPRDGNRRVYLTGGSVTGGAWSERADLAKPYTLHGARSLLGRIQRLWGVELKRPKQFGYYMMEGWK